MVNSKAKDAIPRLKWEQIILVIALALFIAGLGVVSIVSFFQTEYAFKSLNDEAIKGIGNLISIAFAFIFQYGQNAALYIRKKFCNGKVIYTIYAWDITDKTLLLALFWIFAGVDALTNIIWFYKTVEVNPDPFLNVVIRILGYTAMVAAVFVEEILGKTLDAFARATGELKTVLEFEKKARAREKKTNGTDLVEYEVSEDSPEQDLFHKTYRDLPKMEKRREDSLLQRSFIPKKK